MRQHHRINSSRGHIMWASSASTIEVGWDCINSGEHSESPGCIDHGKEGICSVNEGGGVFNCCVHRVQVVSTALKDAATADAASEVEVAEKCQLPQQPWRP